MADPDLIAANPGKQHVLPEGIQPRDACAPNTIWHPFPSGTGSKNANKSAGYFATKQQVAQGKATLPLPSDPCSAPKETWPRHPHAALNSA